MKTTLSRLSAVVALMFVALLAATTCIQVFGARSLSADPRNHRTIVRQNITNRGAIMIGKDAIAYSKPVTDNYRYLRVYPDGDVYAPVTGYFAPTLNASRGLERVDSAILTGTGDSFVLQRLRTLLSGQESQGGSLELTLSDAVQKAAYKAFKDQKGAAVALDPRTGAILAMVSRPSYNPNLLATHDAKAAYKTAKDLEQSSENPLLNRAIQQTYAPGSSFKVITTAALLAQGITPETMVAAPTQYQLPGTNHIITNHENTICGDGSGQVPLNVAFYQSCNPPFAIFGHDLLKFAKLDEQAKKFGFGQSISVPLPVVPSTLTRQTGPVSDTDAAMLAFGQKDLQVTPLQMAMVAAGVANNGVVMRPYLVQTEISSDLAVLSKAEPEVFTKAMTPEIAQTLNQLMQEVVEKGTGKKAQVPGVTVAGKTGTAELNANKPPHAWFIGFAPAQNPTIAVAVVVENSGDLGWEGSGGWVAAPIARAMFEAYLHPTAGGQK